VPRNALSYTELVYWLFDSVEVKGKFRFR